jgi:hypothetical protein
MAAQWTPTYPFFPPAKLEDGRKTLKSISPEKRPCIDWSGHVPRRHGSNRRPMTFDLARCLRCESDQFQRKRAALNNSDGCRPPQPRNSFISAISLYPATIRIDKFLNAFRCLGPATSRHDGCFDRIALRGQCSLFPDIPRDHFRVGDYPGASIKPSVDSRRT